MTNQNRKTSEVELTVEAMDQVSGGATFADMAGGMGAAGTQGAAGAGRRSFFQSASSPTTGKTKSCSSNHNGVHY